jgi:hypothetical protein
MAFSYCPHCGFKNMYSLQAPKFCGGCGEGLSILSAAKTTSSSSSQKLAIRNPISKAPKRRVAVQASEDFDPDGVDIFEVPNISKFSYSIQQDNNKMNLKDLIPLDELDNFQEEASKPKKRGRPKKS